jgi:Ca2+-binding RTX toxin-like protein
MTAVARIALFLAAAAGSLAVAPAAAPAATVMHTAGSGPSNDPYFAYTAGSGERNRLTVTHGRGRVVFTDPGARIAVSRRSFAGCRVGRTRHVAVCKAATPFVEIRLGTRNDTLRFKGRFSGRAGMAPHTNERDTARLAPFIRGYEGAQPGFAVIDSGSGADVIRGTRQGDLIYPGTGADTVDAAGGADGIEYEADGSVDTLRGGRGVDSLDGMGVGPVTIDLAAGTLAAPGETDSLDSIERATGGGGDDTISGTDGADGLAGGGGRDTVDGRAGNDYVGGELGDLGVYGGGAPNVDTITGGAGNDILDGRDSDEPLVRPESELLNCGPGTDRIAARQDDIADPSCESSAFGSFGGDVYGFTWSDYDALTPIEPVSRGADGAPTYRLTCGARFRDCAGRIQLESPPSAATGGRPGSVLGEGEFSIPKGAVADVHITLNDAGRAALARPGERVSVDVLGGRYAGTDGDDFNFGWQQVLGPPGG